MLCSCRAVARDGVLHQLACPVKHAEVGIVDLCEKLLEELDAPAASLLEDLATARCRLDEDPPCVFGDGPPPRQAVALQSGHQRGHRRRPDALGSCELADRPRATEDKDGQGARSCRREPHCRVGGADRSHEMQRRGMETVSQLPAVRHIDSLPINVDEEGQMTETVSMGLGPLRQIAIAATDVERAVAFYRDTLGLPLIASFGPLAFFDLGGIRLLIEKPPPGAGIGSSVLYLAVDDIDAARAALVTKGVVFEDEPHLIHRDETGTFGAAGEEEWMTFFRDSEGNLLALSARRAPVSAAD